MSGVERPAAQHAGPVQSSGRGGVTVSPLYRGTDTALARQPRRKTATICNVPHRQCQVCHVFTKQDERTNFFGWVCLLFFNKHLVNYKIPSMVSVVALWHVQEYRRYNMRARVTGVQADMWLSWAWTGGRALPWLPNQEGKLQQSTMSAARFVIYYRKWVERTNFFDWGCLLFFNDTNM